MFRRNILPVWIGIILLSSMFLMGQESWGPVARMAHIPAGCFDMGDSLEPCSEDPDECPVHNVCITAFEMDVHEVTNAEYARCVAAGECDPPASSVSDTRNRYYGNPFYACFPVIYVDWYQASDYCAWAGKRLPTEAEWEYAARGGLAGKRFPWGDSISGSDANYWDSGDPWNGDTSPVEYYAANGYGLYDVAGNVWEWVEDDYHGSYDCDANPEADYCESGGVAPTDGSAWVDNPRGDRRVLRGGAWHNNPTYLPVYYRARPYPSHTLFSYGIRCAR